MYHIVMVYSQAILTIDTISTGYIRRMNEPLACVQKMHEAYVDFKVLHAAHFSLVYRIKKIFI